MFLVFVQIKGVSQTFVFAELTGTPVDISGWNLTGNAYVGNTNVGSGNEEVILTNPINTQSGGLFFREPINFSLCQKWTAEFEFRIFDGNSADGLTFCFLQNPPVGFVTGGGLGLPPNSDGLKICFDTWRNCGTDAIPKLQMRWGPMYDECAAQPTVNNNNGNLGFIRSNTYNKAKVTYENGTINVFLNGNLTLTGFQQFSFIGYFGFTASTGGFNDRQSVKNVKIFTEMPPSVAGTNAKFCPSAVLTPYQLGTASNNDFNYKWFPSAGLSDTTISNPLFLGADNTTTSKIIKTYYVQTESKNLPGCFSRDSVQIVINTKPKVDFNYTKTCYPNALVSFNNLSSITDIANDSLAFKWKFGDPLANLANPDTSTLKNPNHTYGVASLYPVFLKATSTEGCTDSVTKLIDTLNQKPIAIIQNDSVACRNTNIQFFDVSNTFGSTITNWDWSFSNNFTSTAQNPINNISLPGNYTAKLVIKTLSGCTSDTGYSTISIKNVPHALMNWSKPWCLGLPIQFFDSSINTDGTINAWKWRFDDGDTSLLKNPIHTFTYSDTFRVSLIAKTNYGCVDSVSYGINVEKDVITDFTAVNLCFGNTTKFNAEFSQEADSSKIIGYLWTFNDPNSTINNPDTGYGRNPVHYFSNPGNYMVVLKTLNKYNCSQTISKMIRVEVAPIASFTINNKNSICNNQLVTIVNTSITTSPLAKFKIYWDAANPLGDSTIDLGATLNKAYNYIYSNTGRKIIKIIAEIAAGCSAVYIDSFQFLNNPKLQFGNIPNACINDLPFTISQPVEINGVVGIGAFLPTSYNTATGLFNPANAKVGTNTLTYAYIATNGCVDTAITQITVEALPQINAGPDLFILEGESKIINATATPNVSVLWSPALYLNRADTLTPRITPLANINYNVLVTTTNGCKNSDDLKVEILQDIIIPSAFSPNGDGINDTWEIRYLQFYNGATIHVFDRYGKNVFNSIGYNNPWKGQVNNKPVPAGVYYYIIEPKNGRITRTGSVTVIR